MKAPRLLAALLVITSLLLLGSADAAPEPLAPLPPNVLRHCDGDVLVYVLYDESLTAAQGIAAVPGDYRCTRGQR